MYTLTDSSFSLPAEKYRCFFLLSDWSIQTKTQRLFSSSRAFSLSRTVNLLNRILVHHHRSCVQGLSSNHSGVIDSVPVGSGQVSLFSGETRSIVITGVIHSVSLRSSCLGWFDARRARTPTLSISRGTFRISKSFDGILNHVLKGLPQGRF